MKTFSELRRAPLVAAMPVDPEDPRPDLLLLRRMRVGGRTLGVGSVLRTTLTDAAHLVASGAARPLDAASALDTMLAIELLRVLPRPGGVARSIW